MEVPGFVIAAVLLIAGVIAVAMRNYYFEMLLFRGLYVQYRDVWESLGRPTTKWWEPSDSVGENALFGLPYSNPNPDWLLKAPEMRSLFNKYRLNKIMGHVLFGGSMVFLAVLILCDVVFKNK